MVAKKSSTNAVNKINKQLEELGVSNKEKDFETIPIINKKELNKKISEVQNKKGITNKNSSKKNAKVRDKIIVDDKKKSNVKSSVSTKNSKVKRDDIVIEEGKRYSLEKNEINSRDDIIIDSNNKFKFINEDNSTKKLENLEVEMRTLYDKVNDVIEDLDNEKTVDVVDNIFITDNLILNHSTDVLTDPMSKLDKVSSSFLNRLLIVLFVIFMILFLLFIGFVIFISTF